MGEFTSFFCQKIGFWLRWLSLHWNSKMVYIFADFGEFSPPIFAKKSDFGLDGVKIEIFWMILGGFCSLLCQIIEFLLRWGENWVFVQFWEDLTPFLPKKCILAILGITLSIWLILGGEPQKIGFWLKLKIQDGLYFSWFWGVLSPILPKNRILA